MKVVRVQTREQVDELVRAAGREPQMVEGDEPGAPVTFSVIGEKAKTWGKYKDRAFEGRDDGMMRANS